MNLFIDTNIFLEFHHFKGEDIEELKKLVAMVEDQDIVLFSCPQLREEIKRNRDAKISDAMREFKKINFKESFPAFTKHYPEYGEMRDLLEEANRKHAELMKAALTDVKGRSLAADMLIDELLNKATEVPCSDQIYHSALKRFRMGNPPGKKKVTVGDEMNWEALLAGVPEEEDLMFVSGDGDYSSPIDDKVFHSFLSEEWLDAKSSTIHFYTSLSALLKDKFPQIKLANDVKTAGLIDELAASGSFAMTHALVASLSEHEFSKHQVEKLVAIPELNNQVGRIIGDPDLSEFYTEILKKYGDAMEVATKATLAEILASNIEEPNAPDEMTKFPF